MMNLKALTLDQQHLEQLRTHGARIRLADGTTTELNSFFVGEVQNACIRMGANAITYEMVLPKIPEPMAVCIWKTGHIDSGSPEAIARILDR